jgi:hypothetical protein
MTPLSSYKGAPSAVEGAANWPELLFAFLNFYLQTKPGFRTLAA